jgi:hypothetical protein
MLVGRSWADRSADSSHELGEVPHAVDLERAIEFVGIHEQCAQPRTARADDIDVIEIPHMKRRLGPTPCTFERERKEARVRFFDAFHERVADGVEVAEKPGALEDALDHAVGVRDDRQLHAEALEAFERRLHVGRRVFPEVVLHVIRVDLGEGRRAGRRAWHAGAVQDALEVAAAAVGVAGGFQLRSRIDRELDGRLGPQESVW